jgi:hypothetical protein
MRTWRDIAKPIISEVLALHPKQGPEQRKALVEAYPFGQRQYHPYKVWCDEIRKQKAQIARRENAHNLPLFKE